MSNNTSHAVRSEPELSQLGHESARQKKTTQTNPTPTPVLLMWSGALEASTWESKTVSNISALAGNFLSVVQVEQCFKQSYRSLMAEEAI